MSALADHPPIARPLGEVVTEHLVLRRFRLDDVEPLATVFAKPEVWRYPYGRGFTYDETEEFVRHQIAGWDQRGFGLWLASERGSGCVVGFVGLAVPAFLPEILPAVEVGWRLDPDVWGRGYATEGAGAALREAFTTLELDEVCSIPQVDNAASVRVAERLGMRRGEVTTIAANERRGAVDGLLFWMRHDEWGRTQS